MEPAKPMAEQIAANIEDVQSLLKDNRSLSIALLSRRIKDLEEDLRDRLRKLDTRESERIASLEAAVKTLEDRLKVAGTKFRELQKDVDNLKDSEKLDRPVVRRT